MPGSRSLTTGVCVAVLASISLPGSASTQTFKQLLEIGNDVGPRFTRSDAQGKWEIDLHFQPRRSVRITAVDGSQYQYSVDPQWGRVIFAKRHAWSNGFTNEGGVAGALRQPNGISISPSFLYIADSYQDRVLVAQLFGESLVPVGAFAYSPSYPVSVAWDGGTTPLSTENVYVLDQGLGSVSYWVAGPSSTWSLAWSYGSRGSGQGKFRDPQGVCVGHTASSANVTSVFTSNFYVADTENGRVVWLQRTAGGAVWKGEQALPNSGRPTDCTTDHFGNVYVSDGLNSRIFKYTWNLASITEYGSYGTGESNFNTLAHPVSVHVPFGIKNLGGQNIWYGEGRIVTTEDWGSASGGVEHWLGVELSLGDLVVSAWGPTIWFYQTDHAITDVDVQTKTGAHVAHVLNSLTTPTWHAALWNGFTDQGQNAPPGWYRFRITVTSPYGCSGQAWCTSTMTTPQFYWEPCFPPECYEVPTENVALPLDGDLSIATIPSAYRLGQAITPYAGPLFRVEGIAGTKAGAIMTDAQAVASVRAHGITSLRVDVPREDVPSRVSIRVYSLTGRLVRVLVEETLDAGSYVVGWDGTDAQGGRVLPGVYLAHMTAGGYRGVQRLILR